MLSKTYVEKHMSITYCKTSKKHSPLVLCKKIIIKKVKYRSHSWEMKGSIKVINAPIQDTLYFKKIQRSDVQIEHETPK